jgi:hypothetical protein
MRLVLLTPALPHAKMPRLTIRVRLRARWLVDLAAWIPNSVRLFSAASSTVCLLVQFRQENIFDFIQYKFWLPMLLQPNR